MKKEKGVTLASVIIIVIVTILIASISIVVGNKLILDAKEQKREENYKTVQAAVQREIAKINASGVISPGIHNYVGTKNPVIGRDSSGEPVEADSWYLLTPSDLVKLGVKNVESSYLVNYTSGALIDVDSTDDLVTEINKY